MNKKKKKMIDYGRYGYFFIAPFFITYLVFQLWPLINTFYYSTLSYYKRNGREFMEFAGLQNFVNILGMAAGERGYVLSYLKNTLVMWGCNFVPQILVSLLLAVWLTDEKVKVKGTGAMKVIVYLPSVITAASVSVLIFIFPVRTNHPDVEGLGRSQQELRFYVQRSRKSWADLHNSVVDVVW